jgi:hypothetical protein
LAGAPRLAAALTFAIAVGVAADLAVDSVFAAAVSDFAAVVMALVAVFIACMAVDMVRADDVALLDAAVILTAAEVTRVAADDTVRAAAAGVGACLAVADRTFFTVVTFALVLAFGPVVPALAVRPVAGLRAVPAGIRRAAGRAMVLTGTDLPPVLINYAMSYSTSGRHLHTCDGRYSQNNGPKHAEMTS